MKSFGLLACGFDNADQRNGALATDVVKNKVRRVGRDHSEIRTCFGQLFQFADEMLRQLVVEFSPMARERGLQLTFIRCSQTVRSDRRLLRRLLQNLVSNAVKVLVILFALFQLDIGTLITCIGDPIASFLTAGDFHTAAMTVPADATSRTARHRRLGQSSQASTRHE